MTTKPTEEKVVTPVEAEKDSTVTLSKEQFDTMMERMEEQSADIRVLKKSVSKYRLEENQAKEEKDKVSQPRGFLKRLNGKLIVKWLGKDEVNSKAKGEILYNGTTAAGEILKGHYITLEGEEVVTDAVLLTRSTDLEHFTQTGKDSEGNWIIRFDNTDLPQEYKINPKFVNP